MVRTAPRIDTSLGHRCILRFLQSEQTDGLSFDSSKTLKQRRDYQAKHSMMIFQNSQIWLMWDDFEKSQADLSESPLRLSGLGCMGPPKRGPRILRLYRMLSRIHYRSLCQEPFKTIHMSESKAQIVHSGQ